MQIEIDRAFEAPDCPRCNEPMVSGVGSCISYQYTIKIHTVASCKECGTEYDATWYIRRTDV